MKNVRNVLRNKRYDVLLAIDELKYSLDEVFGGEETADRHRRMQLLANHTKLDVRTVRLWFDSLVTDSGMEWRAAFRFVSEGLTYGKSLSDIYLAALNTKFPQLVPNPAQDT